MTNQQKQEFMEFMRHLLNENIGNKITPAMAIGLFNQLGSGLDEITRPVQGAPNDAKIDPANMPLSS